MDLKIPWSCSLHGDVSLRSFLIQSGIHPEINVHIHHATRTTVDFFLSSATRYTIRKLSERWGMYHLVNARALQIDFLIVGVAYLDEFEDIASTAFRLDRDLTTRGSEGFGKLSGRFIVTLYAIINLEWWSAMENERS